LSLLVVRVQWLLGGNGSSLRSLDLLVVLLLKVLEVLDLLSTDRLLVRLHVLQHCLVLSELLECRLDGEGRKLSLGVLGIKAACAMKEVGRGNSWGHEHVSATAANSLLCLLSWVSGAALGAETLWVHSERTLIHWNRLARSRAGIHAHIINTAQVSAISIANRPSTTNATSREFIAITA